MQPVQSSTHPRAISSTVEGSLRAAPQPNATLLFPAEAKSEPIQPHAVRQRSHKAHGDTSHGHKPSSDLNSQIAKTGEQIRQQQSVLLNRDNPSAQTQSQASTESKRRSSGADRRQSEPYNLASYTGQQANRVYLSVSGAQQGKLIDELA